MHKRSKILIVYPRTLPFLVRMKYSNLSLFCPQLQYKVTIDSDFDEIVVFNHMIFVFSTN